jgi:hypothetical protein
MEIVWAECVHCKYRQKIINANWCKPICVYCHYAVFQ